MNGVAGSSQVRLVSRDPTPEWFLQDKPVGVYQWGDAISPEQIQAV